MIKGLQKALNWLAKESAKSSVDVQMKKDELRTNPEDNPIPKTAYPPVLAENPYTALGLAKRSSMLEKKRDSFYEITKRLGLDEFMSTPQIVAEARKMLDSHYSEWCSTVPFFQWMGPRGQTVRFGIDELITLAQGPEVAMDPDYIYVLCPGRVKSLSDGDYHYITATELARLYGVPFHKCITMHPGMYDRDNYLYLVPKDDGIYVLPNTKI